MTAETDAAKVERLAISAAEAALRTSARRDFTITKFGRHEDGYFHAHVTPAGGKHIYVHCKFGSWMAPGTSKGRAVLKEVRPHVAAELSRKARAIEAAERREAAARTAAAAAAADGPEAGGEADVPDLRA